MLHFIDLESTLQRLKSIADQMEQGRNAPAHRFGDEERTFNGVLFSVRCLEAIDEMSKHPQSINKAVRKGLKDIFTKEEMRSQTPTGCGNRPAMDEGKMKAVRGNLIKLKEAISFVPLGPIFNALILLSDLVASVLGTPCTTATVRKVARQVNQECRKNT